MTEKIIINGVVQDDPQYSLESLIFRAGDLNIIDELSVCRATKVGLKNERIQAFTNELLHFALDELMHTRKRQDRIIEKLRGVLKEYDNEAFCKSEHSTQALIISDIKEILED